MFNERWSIQSVNWVLTHAETSVKAIEDAFKEFTNREDIAIVMINQYVSIKGLLAFSQSSVGNGHIACPCAQSCHAQSKLCLLRRLPI